MKRWASRTPEERAMNSMLAVAVIGFGCVMGVVGLVLILVGLVAARN